MRLFDLDDYKAKKARADESAQQTRTAPRVAALVRWRGQRQRVEFELQPLDGAQVCLAFSPPEKPAVFLVVGRSSGFLDTDYLSYSCEKALDARVWLGDAVAASEQNRFGRLLVREEGFGVMHDFHGSLGLAFVVGRTA